MEPINQARLLLAMIGGTAELVAGVGGHFWADAQTPKKTHRRPLKGRGNYGENLKSHFDDKRFAEKKAKAVATMQFRKAA